MLFLTGGCVYTQWTDWGSCTKCCEGGKQYRYRYANWCFIINGTIYSLIINIYVDVSKFHPFNVVFETQRHYKNNLKYLGIAKKILQYI